MHNLRLVLVLVILDLCAASDAFPRLGHCMAPTHRESHTFASRAVGAPERVQLRFHIMARHCKYESENGMRTRG